MLSTTYKCNFSKLTATVFEEAGLEKAMEA